MLRFQCYFLQTKEKRLWSLLWKNYVKKLKRRLIWPGGRLPGRRASSRVGNGHNKFVGYGGVVAREVVERNADAFYADPDLGFVLDLVFAEGTGPR